MDFVFDYISESLPDAEGHGLCAIGSGNPRERSPNPPAIDMK
jgi:hypothetical protein